MKVFVTGGTGFVGHEIVRQLLEAGHSVRCLVRPGSQKKLEPAEGLETCQGDATEPASLDGLLQGCDAVIHLIGIIREFPSRGITFEKLNYKASVHLLEAAESQGVRRYLHMSANGCTKNTGSGYFQTKRRAEKKVTGSSLNWTVFRPSIIFGRRDSFVNLLANLIRKSPAMPVIGDGSYRLAPVAVEDVAACFVKALQLEAAEKQIFPLCGPSELSYNRLLEIIADALQIKQPVKIHCPTLLVKPFVAVLEKIPHFPITSDQMGMLLIDNICEENEWNRVFQVQAKDFSAESLSYLRH